MASVRVTLYQLINQPLYLHDLVYQLFISFMIEMGTLYFRELCPSDLSLIKDAFVCERFQYMCRYGTECLSHLISLLSYFHKILEHLCTCLLLSPSNFWDFILPWHACLWQLLLTYNYCVRIHDTLTSWFFLSHQKPAGVLEAQNSASQSMWAGCTQSPKI